MNYNVRNTDTRMPAQIQTIEVASRLASKGARVLRLRPADKRPILSGSFKGSTCDIALIANQFQPGENVGVACGHKYGGGLVVLDFDVPVKGQGMELREMMAAKRFTTFLASLVGDAAAIHVMNDTPRIRTSGGGWQVYVRAELGAELKSRDHLDLGDHDPEGLIGPTSDGTSFDTRGENGYVVAPGSVTIERAEIGEDGAKKIKQAAGVYQPFLCRNPIGMEDLPQFSELPVLPAAVIEAINALPTEGGTTRAIPASVQKGLTQNPESQIPKSSILNAVPDHATQGNEQNGTLNLGHRAPKSAQRVRDALSHSVSHTPDRYTSRTGWFEVMSSLAGAAAARELSEEEADAIYEWFCANTSGNKSDNADQWQKTKELSQKRLRNSVEVRGCRSIIDQAVADGWEDPTPKPAATHPASQLGLDEWPGGVKKDKNGSSPLYNAPNAGAMLKRMGFKFRFITRGYFHEVLPPDEYVSAAMPTGWQTIGNAQSRQLTDLVIKGGLRTIRLEIVTQAFKTLGDLVPFDPFKAELECLPKWDGLDRIEDFPSRYLGAQREDITAAWTKHYFMQLMARTYAPGCKADEVLILLGAQRTGKSTALRAIVGDQYFTDALTFRDNAQEIVEKTHRTALAEIAELQGLSGKGADKNKAMISRQEDRARLAYDRATSQVPRSFVLAGTGNDETPFNDPTGALRFMPITVGVIDVAGIKRDRDRLLAEALHKFRAEFGGDARRVRLDPKWWSKAKAETEKYRNIDPWEDTISALLVDERGRLRVWMDPNGKKGFFLSSNELLGRLLSPGYNKTGSHTQRLSKLMCRLGFEKARPQIDNKRMAGYFRPFTPEELAWRSQQVQAGQPIDQGQGLVLTPTLVAV